MFSKLVCIGLKFALFQEGLPGVIEEMAGRGRICAKAVDVALADGDSLGPVAVQQKPRTGTFLKTFTRPGIHSEQNKNS